MEQPNLTPDELNKEAWDRIHRSYVNTAVLAYEEAADFTDVDQLCRDAEEDGRTVTGECENGECYVFGWHATALETFRSDVIDFLRANAADIEKLDAAQVGHDFWLSRNGHGAGFFDRGLGGLGDRLQKAARVYGTCDTYVGDDGWIYAT